MIQAICWVLIHSLWQGAVLAVTAGCVLAGTRRSAAAVRYRLLGGLLFLFLATCGLTFLYELNLAGEIGSVEAPGNVVAANALAVGSGILGRYCEANAEWIVWAWFAVAAVKAVRMAGGWGHMQAISRHGHTEAPEQWGREVVRWAGQLGIRRGVRLLESQLVQAPMVLGHFKPVIFIPLGLINHLPPDEIESVLLHELAHIRRHDYLVNLVQHLSECVLFFNPGLLWVSSLLREERENCCDDIAIARTGDRVGLVRALVRIKEHSMGVAVVAFRPGGKRQLLRRVLRIAQQRNQGLNGGERFFLSASCLLLLLLLSVHRVGGGVVAESRWTVQGRGRSGERPIPEAPALWSEMAGVPLDGHPAAGVAGAVAPGPELMAVLRERQQVAQNMEWAEQQLTILHQHKVKAGRGSERKMMVQQDEEVVDPQQGERNRVQAEIDRLHANRDREQAGRDRVQAELDRAQADRDRQQAERDRKQADRDRQQAELERRQAGKQRITKTTTTTVTTSN